MEMSKEIFVYSDESIFLRGKTEYVGTAHMITMEPVQNDLVINALHFLSTDCDFDNKKDTLTISRRYFHASKDSKNAHGHFCKGIRENIKCSFLYSYVKKPIAPIKNKSNEALARLTFKIASTRFFDEHFNIHFIIESREGFNSNVANDVINSLYRDIERMAYNMPSIISIFPEVNIEFRDKNDPGLQTVDFLLWSMNRSLYEPPNKFWKDQVNLKLLEYSHDENKSTFGGSYYLNENILSFNSSLRLDYPYKTPENTKDGATVLDYYVFIENIIISYADNPIPRHAQFLVLKIEKAKKSILKDKKHFTEKDLEIICSTFIRIFDTIPIYDELKDSDKEQWEDILFARRLSGLVLVNNTINSSRTRSAILRFKWHEQF